MTSHDTEPDAAAHAGPLSDLRVLEMGQLLAGPFCGQLLGDFGAEVIKIEPPGVGDPMRQWGRERPHGLSLWWPVVARGKKSVTLNLRTAAGQEAVRRLVRECDILVENFRPGTLAGWNLAPADLLELNPRLIIVQVTGFGQTGPRSQQTGFGSVGEAMGGLRYITGDPSTPPSRTGISIGDEMAGTMAALGALIAIHARSRTGRGQIVDTSLYESVLAFMESVIPEYAVGGYIRERTGSVLPNVAPSNIYRTRDDAMLIIAANQDAIFGRLCEAMTRPDLATNDHYATHAMRGRHQLELDELIGQWTAEHELDELVKLLEAHAVPNGQIYRAPDMLADPHFAERGSIVTLTHPTLGPFPMQNVHPQLSETPGQVRWLGPRLGEHNAEILGGLLGMTPQAIAHLLPEVNDQQATHFTAKANP